MSTGFDWDGEDEAESMVVQPTLGLAIYQNEDGNVVVRQQGSDFEEEDTVIVIPRGLVKSVSEALALEIV